MLLIFSLYSHWVTTSLSVLNLCFSDSRCTRCGVQMAFFFFFFGNCLIWHHHLYWYICLSFHFLKLCVLTLISHPDDITFWDVTKAALEDVSCSWKPVLFIMLLFSVGSFCHLFIPQKAWSKNNRPVPTWSFIAVLSRSEHLWIPQGQIRCPKQMYLLLPTGFVAGDV